MRKHVLVALLAGCMLVVGATGAGASGSSEEVTYLLTFDDGVDADAVLDEVQRRVPVQVEETFGTVIRGAVVTTSAVPEAIDMVPGVATVDEDEEIVLPDDDVVPDDDSEETTTSTTSTSTTSTTTTTTSPVDPTPEPTPGPQVPWGLDRTDQRTLPLSGSYKGPNDGSGVTVYVLDSGISPHVEFGDRLAPGADLIGDGYGTNDCIGHGTHVAGTIGGRTVGVAPGVTLVPVRVFGCGRTSSAATTFEGMAWIAAHHQPGQPAVVNYSAGGEPDEATEWAVRKLNELGITVVVAGGNEAALACGQTMGADVAGVIVVGWSTPDDRRSPDSNYGRCIDLFAPGEEIRSASAQTGGYSLKSGTSMASPHVAGVAAMVLAQDPWRTAPQVEAAIVSESTQGALTDAGEGSPNRLLFIDPARTPGTPVADASPPPPPAVVSGATGEQTLSETAVLALTGGDPRALLIAGSILLVVGLALVAAERRRNRSLVPAVAAPSAPPLTGFQYQHRRNRP